MAVAGPTDAGAGRAGAAPARCRRARRRPRHAPRPSRRPYVAVTSAAAAAVLLAGGLLPVALGGFGAGVGGPSAAGAAVVAETVGGSCVAAGPTTADATCPASVDALALPGGSTPTTVADTGSVPEDVSVGLASCGVATVAGSGSAGLQAHPAGGLVPADFGQPGPLGGTALTLAGSGAYVGTAGTAVSGPQQFTELAWVRASAGQGGGIVSFANATSPASATAYDRHLWIDPTGHAVAGVYPGSVKEAVGTSVVTDGQWHLLAVTLSSSGLSLYVDGARQTTVTSATAAQAYTGWWSIGAARLNGWADPAPTTGAVSYFTGSLAGVAVLASALSASQVASLAASSTFTAYADAVAADSPLLDVALQDTAALAGAGDAITSGSFVDSSPAADTGFATGAVTAFATGGPLGGAGASFPGSGAYVGTAGTAVAGPQQFTELAWVRAPTGQSGGILGFANAMSPVSATSYDRNLWIDPTGHVVVGVYNGQTAEAVGTSVVTDGQWHLVAATLSSSGLSLYVDGVRQAVDASATSAQNFSGWWSVGASRQQYWPGSPSTTNGVSYFTGSLAGVAVLASALSASQVASLAASSTFTAYADAVAADSPLVDWTMQQLASPCQDVLATVAVTAGGSTTCLVPAAAAGTGCPAASGGAPLADLQASPVSSATPLAAGATMTVTVAIADAGGLPAALAGVEIVADVTVSAAAASWTVVASAPGSWSEL